MIAAHLDQFEILELLLSRGATIPKPHISSCPCSSCEENRACDSLQYSLKRIYTFKALASPAWISLTSNDPILTAFKLRFLLFLINLSCHFETQLLFQVLNWKNCPIKNVSSRTPSWNWANNAKLTPWICWVNAGVVRKWSPSWTNQMFGTMMTIMDQSWAWIGSKWRSNTSRNRWHMKNSCKIYVLVIKLKNDVFNMKMKQIFFLVSSLSLIPIVNNCSHPSGSKVSQVVANKVHGTTCSSVLSLCSPGPSWPSATSCDPSRVWAALLARRSWSFSTTARRLAVFCCCCHLQPLTTTGCTRTTRARVDRPIGDRYPRLSSRW